MGIAILAILLVLFAGFLFAPVSVTVSYRKVGDNTESNVLLGLLMLRIPLTNLIKKKNQKEQTDKVQKEAEKEPFSLKTVENALSRGIRLLKYLKKRLRVNLFSMQMALGLLDAADTGILTGAAYALLYQTLGTLDRNFILKKYEIDVKPVYNSVGLDINFQCKLSLQIRHLCGLIMKIRKEDVK